jgi:hypothetical protein
MGGRNKWAVVSGVADVAHGFRVANNIFRGVGGYDTIWQLSASVVKKVSYGEWRNDLGVD